jgi:FtsP/CotA-like multicopper oxidase with cupredoxin domain
MRGMILLLLGLLAAGARADAAPPGAEEIRAIDGVLSATLRAERQKVRIGDLEVDGSAFNGLYAGPVLRVHPGDRMAIKLVNGLEEETNLHFHGIRTSPLGYSDNVHISVPPGETFTYQVQISPSQPPGLYWFHAHPHGKSARQISEGLSGTITVDKPGAPAMREQLFVLKDMAFDDDTGNETIDDELHGLIQSVNGKLDTAVAMRPGETQFWRFTNQSIDRIFHLALQGHRFHVLAEDGEAVTDDRWSDVIDIPPAKRIEAVVQAGAAGRYALVSRGTITGTGTNRRSERVLGHLDVTGEATAANAAPVLTPSPDLRGNPVDGRWTVAFTQTKTLKAKDQVFMINGRTFDIDRIDVRVPIGTIQEWTVRNDSDDMHVFHIHQIGFQVTKIDGKPVPYTGYVDTVRIPERGSVKLLMPFTDRRIVGRFMFHCHVLKHEDKGMMGQIEVYDPAAPTVGDRLRRFATHVWWWWHGVPWAMCGLAEA